LYEYRVTKYNPAFRTPRGHYTREEWISVHDIGGSFAGIVLTREDFERVETAYVASALSFLREAGLSSLIVTGLENHRRHSLAFSEGSNLSLEQLGDAIRMVLREEYWCRFESTDGFVHIGWDFYMYVGVQHPCPTARAEAAKLGLYVEEFRSPYNKVEGDEE
jgi:hypothetical protein